MEYSRNILNSVAAQPNATAYLIISVLVDLFVCEATNAREHKLLGLLQIFFCFWSECFYKESNVYFPSSDDYSPIAHEIEYFTGFDQFIYTTGLDALPYSFLL